MDEQVYEVNHIRESADNLLWLIANGQIYCFDPADGTIYPCQPDRKMYRSSGHTIAKRQLFMGYIE